MCNYWHKNLLQEREQMIVSVSSWTSALTGRNLGQKVELAPLEAISCLYPKNGYNYFEGTLNWRRQVTRWMLYTYTESPG